jgi:hypothetical protein
MLCVILQVDDDDKSDLDDDELEAINATAAAATNEGEATTAGGATTKEGDKQKSVRMSVTGAPGGALQCAACVLFCVQRLPFCLQSHFVARLPAHLTIYTIAALRACRAESGPNSNVKWTNRTQQHC